MAIFSLNEVGAFLWEELAAARTEDELVARLVTAFEVESAEAAADVKAFLAQLVGKQLISREER
jgi:hypothetical protein